MELAHQMDQQKRDLELQDLNERHKVEKKELKTEFDQQLKILQGELKLNEILKAQLEEKA
jgi:hypothetical protein